jgi:hypothetical protein
MIITAEQARAAMPENKVSPEHVLEIISELILEAVSKNEYEVNIPNGVFPELDEKDAFYNAKYSPLIWSVNEELKTLGYKLKKNNKEMVFTVSWKEY